MAQAYDAATNNKRLTARDTTAAKEHFEFTLRNSPQHGSALAFLERALRRRIDFAVARPPSLSRAPTRVYEVVDEGFWEDLDTDVIEFGLRRAFPGCDAECGTTEVVLRWDQIREPTRADDTAK